MAYPNGKKHYADLTKDEKLVWHTGVYAFRHVRLDAPIEPGSPPDPDGQWFDRAMIDAEVRKMRRKHDEAMRDRRAAKDIEFQREGRDIVSKWAQARGFTDIDEYCERNKIPWVDAYTNWRSFADALTGPTQSDNPQEAAIRARKRRETLGLGEFNPTPAEMAASRKRLGIPEPDQPQEPTNA